MKIEKISDVTALLDEKQTRSNKELLIAASICTLVGIIIGFVIGKVSTNNSIIKKYNKKFTYDFGDDE